MSRHHPRLRILDALANHIRNNETYDIGDGKDIEALVAKANRKSPLDLPSISGTYVLANVGPITRAVTGDDYKEKAEISLTVVSIWDGSRESHAHEVADVLHRHMRTFCEEEDTRISYPRTKLVREEDSYYEEETEEEGLVAHVLEMDYSLLLDH